MSGFSSLGGNKEHRQQQSDNCSSNSLFLFKNEEIYNNKGFELWQQYNQHHHQQRAHHHHGHSIQDVDFFSVGPSRRNTEANNNHSSNGLITGDDPWNCYSYRSSSGFGMLRQGRSSGGGGDQGINCQDCGNQAKKDCVYMRCRTCCKSRGFECQTHVKSTWVPAAKRRERQHQQQQLSAMNQQEVRGESSKRLRESSSLVAYDTTSSRLAAKTSGFELGHFPAEVNSPAVFRCVRVSAMDDPKEHLAYQTSVNISGHVFKGILYDQGPENRYYNPSSSIGGGGESSHHRQRPRDLISGAATTTTAPSASTAAAIAGSSVNVITSMVNDPSSSSSIYPTPLSAFMAGTQFFPPPRS